MNSVAVPVIEYRAITECGRAFSWSAETTMSAIYEIKRDKGLTVVWIERWSSWEVRSSVKEVAKAS